MRMWMRIMQAPSFSCFTMSTTTTTTTTTTTANTATSTSSSSTLSSRGQRAIQPATSYIQQFIQALQHQYDPHTNPTGYVLMCVAENKLNWSMLRDRLSTSQCRHLPDDAGGYSDFTGRVEFRQQLARYMQRAIVEPTSRCAAKVIHADAHAAAAAVAASPSTSSSSTTTTADFTTAYVAPQIEAQNVCIGAGLGAVVDTLVTNLCEPGDGILIPAPYYPAWDNDLTVRAGVIPVPVHTQPYNYDLHVDAFARALRDFNEGADSSDDHATTAEDQESQDSSSSSDRAVVVSAATRREDFERIASLRRSLVAAGLPPSKGRIRAVLLTNPSNPLGIVQPFEQIRAVALWALSLNLHVIIDEVYAKSVFRQPSSTVSESASAETAQGYASLGSASQVAPFVSALHLLADPLVRRPELLHFLYGMSKDFAVSGYRVGWLYSRNAELCRSWGNVGYFISVSNDLQVALTHLLRDEPFIDAYLERNALLLGQSYAILEHAIASLARELPPEFHISVLPQTCAAMFAWLDLRSIVRHIAKSNVGVVPVSSTPTAEPAPIRSRWHAEERLWLDLCECDHIILTPGQSCHSNEPGFFRCCFACVSVDHLRVGVDRLCSALRAWTRGDRM